MRFAALALLLGLPCVGTTSVARAAEPDTYIFDVLPLQPYKGNFARLVGGEGLPDWVHAIAVQGAGAAGPSRTVDVAGTPYRLDRVCKVGAPCAEDRIDVLWAPRGAKVWAALVEGGKPPVLLGGPKGAQEQTLRQAVAGSSAPAAGTAVQPAAQPAAQPVSAAPQAAAASAPPSMQAAPAATVTSQATPSPRMAEADPYIFDVLPLQPYKGNFARLVKGKGLPDWVRAISAQGAGSAGPARTVDVAGTAYRLDRVCKVGASCASDRVDVLWAPRGVRVWAALVEGGGAPVLLGEPKGAQAAALTAASEGKGLPSSSSADPAAAPTPVPPVAAASAPPPPVVDTAAGTAAAPADIFDALAAQPYKSSFARLLKEGVPAWVKAIAVQGTGVAGPPRTVDVAGRPYRLDRVCAVRACADHRLDVLWAPGGGRAWAALNDGGKAARMLGHPEGGQAEALMAASRAPVSSESGSAEMPRKP